MKTAARSAARSILTLSPHGLLGVVAALAGVTLSSPARATCSVNCDIVPIDAECQPLGQSQPPTTPPLYEWTTPDPVRFRITCAEACSSGGPPMYQHPLDPSLAQLHLEGGELVKDDSCPSAYASNACLSMGKHALITGNIYSLDVDVTEPCSAPGSTTGDEPSSDSGSDGASCSVRGAGGRGGLAFVVGTLVMAVAWLRRRAKQQTPPSGG